MVCRGKDLNKLIYYGREYSEELDTRGALRCVRFESGNVGVVTTQGKTKLVGLFQELSFAAHRSRKNRAVLYPHATDNLAKFCIFVPERPDGPLGVPHGGLGSAVGCLRPLHAKILPSARRILGLAAKINDSPRKTTWNYGNTRD